MSRSGYSDDLDPLDLGRWRGIIASATRGKRGQKFFRDLVAALDAMPVKALVESVLEKEGAVCALGALARYRGLALPELDTYDHEGLGEAFGVAHQLAQEVMFENDDAWPARRATPEERWRLVRAWAAKQVSDPAAKESKE